METFDFRTSFRPRQWICSIIVFVVAAVLVKANFIEGLGELNYPPWLFFNSF